MLSYVFVHAWCDLVVFRNFLTQLPYSTLDKAGSGEEAYIEACRGPNIHIPSHSYSFTYLKQTLDFHQTVKMQFLKISALALLSSYVAAQDIDLNDLPEECRAVCTP